MSRVVINREGVEALLSDAGTGAELRAVAEQLKSRVSAPPGMELSVKAGKAGRGSHRGKIFAQVIMRGEHALRVEFGSKYTPALAPLRRALRSL